MLTIAIFILFFGIGAVSLANFLSDQALESDGRLLVQYIRQARTNAVAQLEDSSWGLYFNTTPDPDEFTLFNGSSYASRNTDYDVNYSFRPGVDINAIALTGGGNELIFSKRSGQTSQSGTIQLSNDTDIFDISVNGLGLINF